MLSLSSFSFFNPSNVFISRLNVKDALGSSYVFLQRTWLIIRWLLFLIALAVNFVSLLYWFGFRDHVKRKSPIYTYPFYLTKLSAYSVTIYFGFSTIAAYLRKYNGYTPSSFFSTVCAWLYACNSTFQLIVIAFYWGLLYKRFADLPVFGKVSSLLEHGTVACLVLLDMVLGNMGIQAWSVLPVFLTVCLYVPWALIFYKISGIWVYPQLDFNHAYAKYAYPGLFVVPVLVFFLVYGLHRLKLYAVGAPIKKQVLEEDLIELHGEETEVNSDTKLTSIS